MATYKQVFEFFGNYLKDDSCIDVVLTKWGYVRIFYEEPYIESLDAVLCCAPEALFQVLLEYFSDEFGDKILEEPQSAEEK